jgi:hypothetical protein
MTFTELYQKYLGLIWKAFEYDISVFSQGWIYYWLLIPASFYFMFFIVKWAFLTAPLWIPIAIVWSFISEISGKIVYAATTKKKDKS